MRLPVTRVNEEPDPSLQWRQSESDGVSNDKRLDFVLNQFVKIC